jgi:hypothetical protein
VKISSPVLILVEVDWDATGISYARKTERVHRLSDVGLGEWKRSSPSKLVGTTLYHDVLALQL